METRLNNKLSTAHLKGCPEDIAMCVNSAARELPDGIAETLETMGFIDKGQNVSILGPSDIGKSYLAKVLGILACSRFSVEYHHCEPLVESLTAMKAKAYDKYQKKIRQLTKRNLLIIDLTTLFSFCLKRNKLRCHIQLVVNSSCLTIVSRDNVEPMTVPCVNRRN